MNKKIAVLIPCYNEEKTVEKVVSDFKKELPNADIYIYDNNSTDKTYLIASKLEINLKKEFKKGKGNVVRSMFRDIEADYYILVDGDDTYPVEKAHLLLEKAYEGYDMVVGDRISNNFYSKENKRIFHDFGNNLVIWFVNKLFKANLKDIMSGYRCFSKRFVKSYPVLPQGFQIETDMTIFALYRFFSIKEIPVEYRDRPKGSVSKLNTYSDGLKVLLTIFNLYRYYFPFKFFSIVSSILLFTGLVVGFPVIVEYIDFKYVYKTPSAVLASSLVILSFLSFISGVILDSVKHSNKELFEIITKIK